MCRTSVESLGVSRSPLRKLYLIAALRRRSARAAACVSFALALAMASTVVYGADPIVGRWVATRSSDAGGMSYQGSLSYEIFPNGSYRYSTVMKGTMIGCRARYETGTVRVQGEMMTFLPTSGTKGDCNERGTALPTEELKQTTHPFRLDSGAQQLCIRKEGGDVCYRKAQ
jgi:hypothetical protein